ncbi:GNAT family N-acetyltransferase [Hymenobacter sp. HMF4947]|uniref:GNAT family N-acetyltransferase n=1 Tax=Hymenobacter ginkgonis TaxID=2682976 RepID=A0A7K1TGP2_9BACT|nr:GNAT family N-acetyltransferase [Hymenobacter ginkgonis]MVN77578.1 GNAT family N-acetyltransferase [Hymenobacter ginkgonis]
MEKKQLPLLIVAQTAEHIPALRHLYLEARKKAFTWLPPERFQLQDFDVVTAQEQVGVALQANTPVGFISWWPPDNFIHSLFVNPALVRHGIGQALLQYCLQRIGRPTTLKCLQTNTPALRFYAAQGWRIVGSGEAEDGAFLLLAYGH